MPKFPAFADGSQIGIPISDATHLRGGCDPAASNLLALEIYGKGLSAPKFPGVEDGSQIGIPISAASPGNKRTVGARA